MRVLGIDPGSRLTGFACVDVIGRQVSPVSFGTLKLPLQEEMSVRLFKLHEGISNLATTLKPQVLVVEKIFFAKNALSALKLGQARGVILLAASQFGMQLAEYSPTEVKKAIVGHGRAEKEEIAKMLGLIFGKKMSFETFDASDALALAVCHAYIGASPARRRIEQAL